MSEKTDKAEVEKKRKVLTPEQLARLKRRDALVIDDEPEVLETYVTTLSSLSCFRKIVTARDGADAFKKIVNQEFGLIITDLILPRLSGMQLLKYMSEQEFTKTRKKKRGPPVVVISGMLEREVIQELLGLGVRAIIAKPLDQKSLREKIHDLLNLPDDF